YREIHDLLRAAISQEQQEEDGKHREASSSSSSPSSASVEVGLPDSALDSVFTFLDDHDSGLDFYIYCQALRQFSDSPSPLPVNEAAAFARQVASQCTKEWDKMTNDERQKYDRGAAACKRGREMLRGRYLFSRLLNLS
ncbi:hypothetical protein FOZ63_000447, partial [Perkinsus olseni]